MSFFLWGEGKKRLRGGNSGQDLQCDFDLEICNLLIMYVSVGYACCISTDYVY